MNLGRKIKGRPKPAFALDLTLRLRLFRSDCVLGSLGDAELHYGLALIWMGSARLWLLQRGLSGGLSPAGPWAGHDEYAVLFLFLHSDVGASFLQK